MNGDTARLSEASDGSRESRRATSALIGLLAAAHFSHHVLTAIIPPLLPFIRDDFALSYAQTGVVGSAFTIAYGISQLPAGWLADRIGARYLLLASITGVAIIGALVGLSPGFGALLAALLIMGILGGGYHPSSASVIARAVPEQRRGRAMGIHIVGGSSSYFVAPLIAAGLVSVAGWRGTFLSLSVPVAILGLGLFWMMRRTLGPHDRSEHTSRTPAEAGGQGDAATAKTGSATEGSPGGRTRSATDDSAAARVGNAPSRRVKTQLVFFMVVVGLHGATIGSMIPFIPLYLADVRGVDERIAAGFISIIFATGFFAAPLGGWLSDTFGRVRVMIGVALITGPALLLATVAPFPAGFAVVLALIGTLMFTKMPTAEAHISSTVASRNRTTVLGIYYFSGAEVGAVLTPILGASIDVRGFDASFAAFGIMYATVAVICSIGMIASRSKT